MKNPSSTVAPSVRAPSRLPNGWAALLGVEPTCSQESNGHTPPEPGGSEFASLTTAGYATETFAVLHLALRSVQAGQSGPRLDALAGALQRLLNLCEQNASDLAGITLDHDARPLTRLTLSVEVESSKAIADSVRAVWLFVRGRALGDVNEQDRNALWEHLWHAISASARRVSND